MARKAPVRRGLGHQIAVDLYGCSPREIDHIDAVRGAVRQVVSVIGAEIVGECFHKFSPQGVSGVVAISLSHIAVHTWPEHRYVAVDIFTCGSIARVKDVVRQLEAAFSAGESEASVAVRGAEVLATAAVGRLRPRSTPADPGKVNRRSPRN